MHNETFIFSFFIFHFSFLKDELDFTFHFLLGNQVLRILNMEDITLSSIPDSKLKVKDRKNPEVREDREDHEDHEDTQSINSNIFLCTSTKYDRRCLDYMAKYSVSLLVLFFCFIQVIRHNDVSDSVVYLNIISAILGYYIPAPNLH